MIKCEHLKLTKIAQVSLEYCSHLLSAGTLVVYILCFEVVDTFSNAPCFDGQWQKDFSSLLNQEYVLVAVLSLIPSYH